MVDGRIQFFIDCWTEDLSSLLAVATSLVGPLHRAFKAVGFTRARKLRRQEREQASRTEVTVSYDLILKVTSHHFCSVLLIRNVVQPILQEREFHRA